MVGLKEVELKEPFNDVKKKKGKNVLRFVNRRISTSKWDDWIYGFWTDGMVWSGFLNLGKGCLKIRKFSIHGSWMWSILLNFPRMMAGFGREEKTKKIIDFDFDFNECGSDRSSNKNLGWEW